jgi:hypothetical protein
MSDDRLQNRLERASKAEALMRSEILAEAFDKLKREYYEAILSLGDDQTLEMQILKHAALNVEFVRSHLSSVAQDGKMVRRQIEELTLRTRAKGVA